MYISCKQLAVVSGGCFTAGVLIGCGIFPKLKIMKFFKCLKINWDVVWPFNACYMKPAPTSAIYVIASNTQFDEVFPLLKQDLMQIKLLGFDCEWTSSNNKKHPVALLQLATSSGMCLLIRIGLFKDTLPSTLIDILKDPEILKVGVGCFDDGQKLFNDYGLIVNGCVDVRFLAQLDHTVRLQKFGLQSLASAFLHYKMNKSREVRCSNWDGNALSKTQISYAADDALVGIKLFSKLIFNWIETNSQQAQKSVCDMLSKAIWNAAYAYCQAFIDVKFKEKFSSNGVTRNKNHMKTPKQKKVKYASRQSAMYDNCKLQAPDGQLLATCDKKKADWYISKELADVVCEEPYTVRLRFEPAGRPSSSHDYYLYDKENFCVVCKSSGPIVRKNIVPHEYRKHFPLEMKDHSSHDILPLCVGCHQRSGYYDVILRSEFADTYAAPLGSVNAVQVLENPERRSVRSAGRALLQAGSKIPLKRRNELENIIKDFFQVDELSESVIVRASLLETKFKNESYIPHGEKVVTTIFTAEKLKGVINFERKWRQHFLDNMQPMHLPALWSVDHNHRKVVLKLTPEECAS